MTKIEKNYDIKRWIYSVMKLTGYKLDLIEQSKGINMSYNFIHNRLGVDLSRVKEARRELTIPVPLQTYIEVMTLHELGHAADREALLESLPWTIEVYDMKKNAPPEKFNNDPDFIKIILDEQLMNIEFEKTAWSHAESMNRQYKLADEIIFESIRKHSMASYENPYLQNLKLYNRLMTDSAELTA